MCKQDVQIGRKSKSVTTVVTAAAGAATPLLAARGGRLFVHVAWIAPPAPGLADSVLVGFRSGATVKAVGVVGSTWPNHTLSVERHGSDVLGELVVTPTDVNGGTVHVTEVYLLDPLEDI
jgi:hypothetical protein